jgi:hypothetical protein
MIEAGSRHLATELVLRRARLEARPFFRSSRRGVRLAAFVLLPVPHFHGRAFLTPVPQPTMLIIRVVYEWSALQRRLNAAENLRDHAVRPTGCRLSGPELQN